MGQKTHPIGFRLGIIKDWQAKWYAAKGSQYRELLQEDLSIRNAIRARLPEAGISKVELERGAQELVVTIHSARPGIVIGRGGQRVEEGAPGGRGVDSQAGQAQCPGGASA